MHILGIETSCDETAAAIVADGRTVVSNVVYTQIPLHRQYGGVVPEIASRAHVEKIPQVVKDALTRPVDAVAVTYGPGLSPALIVGLNAAKGLAKALGVPLFGINHIEAHLHTPFLRDAGDEGEAVPIEESMPALGLAVSGGHTNWIDMPEYGVYETVGQTLDDAAGEAFDKAAKLLGLGYPGGPVIDRIAREYGHGDLMPFPRGRPREGVSALAGLDAELCVSFSGLKTSLLRYVQKRGGAEALAASGDLPKTVASYQEAIVQSVADRTMRALKRRDYRSLIVGGGVSLNSRMREVLSETCARAGVRILLAKPKYCGDNGAMIAALAYYRRNVDASLIDVSPSLEVG
ncbi:MAG: tRNA (adenosine(37)-N6)-threonylcarbamoyltransferase complex transferase subunit TsaD [Kiritimatiellae bacterium]|nr:tRNA (adenosine(37)-N6)-threonylcarbamoyltransferase complex transferase subunit TsaD [Kiritimatiellia bacterium]